MVVGGVLIIHAAYSTVHYKELVKEAGVTNVSLPPADAVLEIIVGYLICMFGILSTAGSFTPIRSTEQIASRCVWSAFAARGQSTLLMRSFFCSAARWM